MHCYFSKHYILTAQFREIALGSRKLLTGSSKLVSLSTAARQGAWPSARHSGFWRCHLGSDLVWQEALMHRTVERLSNLTSGLSQMHRRMRARHPDCQINNVRSLLCLLVCQMKLDCDGSKRGDQSTLGKLNQNSACFVRHLHTQVVFVCVCVCVIPHICTCDSKWLFMIVLYKGDWRFLPYRYMVLVWVAEL